MKTNTATHRPDAETDRNGDVPSFDLGTDRPADAGNVLTSPVFTAKLVSREVRITLPGILAACATENLVDFPAVRTHQAHTVHMFLAHLYALASEMIPEGSDLSDEATWRESLLNIEPDGGAGIWDIVGVSDDAPAFMQPAVPQGLVLKNVERTPSAIDLLVTANEHVTKSLASGAYDDEVWLWHLITLQTGAGFPGRGNYGTFRMNGGFSSRCVWAVYDRSWTMGRRVTEDASLINETAARTYEKYGFSAEGSKLLWARSWKENEVLGVEDLDPRVIEVCRRIRLARGVNGEIFARIGNSTAARTDLKPMCGDVGDIWAPIAMDKESTKALAIGDLDYARIARATLGYGGDVRPSPATLRRVHDGVLVAVGVANGQGKTEGFFSRSVPFTNIADSSGWGSAEIPEGVAGAAEEMIREARKAVSALNTGITMLTCGGAEKPSKVQGERGRTIAAPYVVSLSGWVDENFFPALNDRLEEGAVARIRFAKGLYQHAEAALETAISALPLKASDRFRVIERAWDAFRGVFFSKGKAGDASFNDIRGEIMRGNGNE